MKTISTTLAVGASAAIALAALGLGVTAVSAQERMVTCANANTERPLNTYDGYELHADGRVLFRLCAPEAESVTVNLRGDRGAASQSLVLERDDMGYWTGTTADPVLPGVHRYSFRVAGLNVTDPMNYTIEQSIMGLQSVIEVPGSETAFYAYDPDIPHGAIQIVEYWSDTLGTKRRARIYTPPGYTGDDTNDYPVLYLIHGGGGTDDVWATTGRAHYILDNLIASGEAEPMVVVMPEAHTPITEDLEIRYNTRFRDDLITDLIPYVDATYRTQARPESRAMAGLSMGSAHTWLFGLPRSDLFRYTGHFSMGLGGGNPMADPDIDAIARYEDENVDALRRSAQEMELVYFAFGSADPWLYSVAPARDLAERHGIENFEYHETPGAAHDWLFWRERLRDFASRIFK